LSQGTRRLAAIMFTDMVGYTALGQRNESLSLALVEEQRKLIRPILSRHNGREVKTMGDAFLVEFANVLDATRCAYDIQRATREFNVSLPDDHRVHLRIGVHLGDVVESNGDISGDAVNLASRIEPLSEDGGVCVTRSVYDQVENKFELPLRSIGPKQLKNVKAAVEVFKMEMPWETGNSTPTQPDKKRIAVLPFVNMSPDSSDEYFADGMTEEIISTLSNISQLTVISRTSVMKFKGEKKRLPDIGRELMARSFLEGSVRKAGSHIRITVQLLDAVEDKNLWSKFYDRELQDIFACQSEIAQSVAAALKVELLSGEKRDIERRPTASPEAHALYLKGRFYWNERTKEGNEKAMKYFEEAIKRDSDYALAYAALADCYVVAGVFGWMKLKEAFPSAKGNATKAIEIYDRTAEAHTILAAVFAEFEWKGEDAEKEYRQAIELKQSYATVHQWHSMFLTMAGRLSDAYDEAKKAKDLDPLSGIIRVNLAERLLHMGRTEEAVGELESLKQVNPDFGWARCWLGIAYFLGSRPREAIQESRAAVELLGGDPVAKSYLACVLGASGYRDEATDILQELQEKSAKSPILIGYVASILFTVGRTDEAFQFLGKAFEERSITMDLWNFFGLQLFEKLRGDPRWGPLDEMRGFKGTLATN
jgi:adenylate cyclase